MMPREQFAIECGRRRPGQRLIEMMVCVDQTRQHDMAVSIENRTARRNRLCASRNRFDDPAAVHDDTPRRAIGEDRVSITVPQS